jgi:hypothetical protein
MKERESTNQTLKQYCITYQFLISGCKFKQKKYIILFFCCTDFLCEVEFDVFAAI